MADRNQDAAGSAPTAPESSRPASQDHSQGGSLSNILSAIDRWVGVNILGHSPSPSSPSSASVPSSGASDLPSSRFQPTRQPPTPTSDPTPASNRQNPTARASDLIPPISARTQSFPSPTETIPAPRPTALPTSLPSLTSAIDNDPEDATFTRSSRESTQPGEIESDPQSATGGYQCEGIQCPSTWIIIVSACALLCLITTVVFLFIRRKRQRQTGPEDGKALPISANSSNDDPFNQPIPPSYTTAATTSTSLGYSSQFTSSRGSLTTASDLSTPSPAPAHLRDASPVRGAVEISQAIPTQGIISMYGTPVFHPPPPPESKPPSTLTGSRTPSDHLSSPAYTRSRNDSIPSMAPLTQHSTVTSYHIPDPAITRALSRSSLVPSSPVKDRVYVGEAENREMMEPEVDPTSFVRQSVIHPTVGEPIAEDKGAWWETHNHPSPRPPLEGPSYQAMPPHTVLEEEEEEEEEDHSAQATPYVSSTSTTFPSARSHAATYDSESNEYSDTNSSRFSNVSFQSTYTIKSRMSRKITPSPRMRIGKEEEKEGEEEEEEEDGWDSTKSTRGSTSPLCPKRVQSFSHKVRDDSGALPRM
ncbi:MAG: hypothetical protein DHS80DRAFT_25311 [Piptocephalis tieghemiana]|nr:MAG: hypothetical protein DHS80DRAFT_25311 [Piptocephalis tieghemiana]